MGGILQSPQISELTESLLRGGAGGDGGVDLSARVMWFPVRHHSPACAWHVQKLIREVKPQVVLIEGPRDATELIPLILHKETRLPIAIYTTYVQRTPDDEPPRRHAAYYPLCEYSPELVALRTAQEVGATAKFIDLAFPEMVVAERREATDQKARSLQSERHLRYSRFLDAACRRAGARDADDLWDRLYETSARQIDTAKFIRNVLAYCALARMDHTSEMLEADGTLARESAMAHAVAKEKGRVIVVTGGFHTVALPQIKGKAAEKVDVAANDALVVLMRYGFEQLDRLNGYNSGMPAPEFYQRLWDGRDVTEIFVELGRACRKRGQEISVADEMAALDQCRRLSLLRGHAMPSREDVLDGLRSSFVKGAADAEGLSVLAMARQFLAGERVGSVPESAGQPPLVMGFRASAARLRIDIDKIRAAEVHLDLYRRVAHRETSRFFHRLKFLNVPFAELLKGPDFVAGKDLERIQEIWKYHWSPEVDSALIERSLYGASLEEASLGLLVERFGENERSGQGRRSDLAAGLVLEACRMGLHRHTADLLSRTAGLIGEDQAFPSLVRAMDRLLVLHVSREPLEAHSLKGILDLCSAAYERACYLIPSLAMTPEEAEQEVLDAMVDLHHCVRTLGDDAERQTLRSERLKELGLGAGGNAAVRGAALGLLYGDGRLEAGELATAFRGHLLGGDGSGEAAAAFLRGLLRTARSALWQVEQIINDLHETLATIDESHFVHQLPLLRLAFADLTPRETDRVAEVVALRAGVKRLHVASSTKYRSTDMALAVEVQRRVAESLAADGLAAWGKPEVSGE